MKKVRAYSLLVFFSLFFQFAQAQVPVSINSGNPAFPFPQFLDYGTDRKTLASVNAPGVTHAEMEQTIRDAWQIFANSFIYSGEAHAGVKYIKGNIGCPYDCSEGDGYALLGAAYMADKTTFDGLWFRTHDLRRATKKKYTDCNATIRAGYKYGENTLAEPGGDAATDGDNDIALALLMAWKQWGDNSGYNDACGNPISYKTEALEVIRGLVERKNSQLDPNRFDCRSVSGNVGFDGYLKKGNTWGELTRWASNDPTWCPEFPGIQDLFADYMAPSYYHAFADFLQTQGGSPEDLAWNINQFKRAEASCDWLSGKLLESSPRAIAHAGKVAIDVNNVPTFTAVQHGEDFRFAWRTTMNYMWHGNPTTTWDPVTHQVKNTPNSFQLDISKRHSQFLTDPGKAPWNNTCLEVGGGPALTYSGPSQISWQYTPLGAPNGDFPLNWNPASGSPAAVSAQDFALMGKLYRQCAIEWDVTTPGDGYLSSVPVYFHGWFRLLGMLVLSGSNHSPMKLVKESNVKVYHQLDKTYAFTGDQLVYTIKYRNYASVAATGVKITTTIPAGLEYVSSTGGGTNAGGVVTWNVNNIPGFSTSGGITPTQGQFTMTVKVAPGFSGQICNIFELTTTNGQGWISNEYPNNQTAILERNCVDIVEKAMKIDKSVDYKKVNPGQKVTYTVNFENASSGGFINGGRPGVNFAYAHDGTAASASQHAIKIRLYHGAVEPYVDYGNYRISMFLNDNTNNCIFGQNGCTNGWVLDKDIYEGGDATKVKISSEDIVPGSDSKGSWNQRVIVQFANQLTTTTTHVSRYFGMGQRVHQGGTQPLRVKWRLHTNSFGPVKWDDDWSWNANAQDADDGLFLPVTNDFTDIHNPNVPVTIWHNEACEKPTRFVDNILVEEWDGYTWRRIYGNSPVPGRDVNNVVVTDILPAGFTFGGFIDASGVNVGNTISILGQNATYNSTTRTISWSIPKLQVKQGGRIKYIATAGFSSGACNRADELRTNTASIVGTNESPVTDTANVTVTCTEVILPPAPSSMTKTANKANYALAENVTYTLTYTNTDGSITNADLTSAAKWVAQSGAAMPVSAGSLTSVNNDPGVMTYNQSHGTNGTIEASFNFGASAAFGVAFRHTGGAKANGQYIVFKPNSGAGIIEVRAYNGTTQVGTTQTIGYPGDPTNLKIELNGGQVNVWAGNTSNPTPTVTFTGFTVKAGYAGVINGWANDGGDSYGTHRLRSFKTHLDSAFDLELSDPVPTGITFTSASNSGTNTAGTVRFPVIAGPVLANAVTTRTWVGTVATCPTGGKIVNNAYTNILGITTNSIASQVIVSCGGSTCTPPSTPSLANISLCQGAPAPTVPIPATSGNSYVWYTAATGTTTTTPDFTTTNAIVRTYFVAERTPNNGGCESARRTFTFTVNPTPTAPTAPTISPICAGNTATLNKTGTATGNFYWYTGTTGGSPNTNPFTTPVLSSNTNYYLVDSVANGCKSTRTLVVVTVNPTPTAPTAPTISPICSGNTATLNKTGTATGSFYWYGTIAGGTPKANPFTTPILNATTTYYLIDSTANCKSARTPVEVTVNQKPAALFTFTPATGITTATSVTFNNPNAGTSTYIWKIDGVQENTNPTFSKTFATNKNYVVRLVATSANGCKDSTEQTVSVGVVPCTPPATPTISDVNVCEGTTVQAIPTPSTANNTYVWYTSASGTSPATPDYGTGTAITRTYFVAERTPLNGGCESTVRDEVKVTIHPKPTVQFTFTPATGITTATSVTFNNTSTGAASYIWKIDGIQESTNPTTFSKTFATNKTYVVRLIATTANSCKDSLERDVIVGVVPCTPPATPIISDVNVCQGDATPTIPTPNTANNAYVWYTSSSGTSPVTPDFSTNNTTPRSYFVAERTPLNGGCESTVRDEVKVAINALPTPTLTTPFSQCGGTVDLKTLSSAGNIFYTDTLPTAIALTNTVVATSGVFYVQTTSAQNCKSKFASGKLDVTIKAAPVADVNPKTAPYCGTGGSTLTATNAGTGATYEWFLGTSSMGTPTTNNTLNNALAGSYTVKTTLDGCSTTSTVPAVVSVVTAIVPKIKIKANSLDTCLGSAMVVNIFSQDNGTVQWFEEGVAQGTGNQHVFNLTKTTKIKVVLTSSESCANPKTAADSVTINARPAVVPTVSITPDAQDVCEGTSVNFSASPADGLNYEWYVGTVRQVASTNTFSTNTLKNNDIVRVVYASPAVCANPKTAEASVPMTIKPKLAPSLKLKPTSTQVCAGEEVTFEIGVQENQGTSPTYSWFVNNTSFAAPASASSITTPISATTNVHAVVTSSEACVSSPTANSDTLKVSVNTGVTPLVEITPIELKLCGTNTGSFSISKIEGEGTTPVYQWLLNGNPIANANSSSLNISTLADGDKIALAFSSSSTCKLKAGDTSNVANILIKTKPVATINQPVTNGNTYSTSLKTVDIQAVGANGVWEKSGLGTLSTTSGAATVLAQNTVGTTEVRWVVSDASGICPSDTARVFVKYVDGPFANAGADAEKCESETIELKGQGSATGTWASLTTGASLTGTGSDVAVSQKIVGINQFSYCVTDNSVTPIQKICDTVEITVRPTIIPTISILRTLTSVDNCVGDLAEFTATASAGTITWSNGSTGTTGTYTDWNNNDQVIATITNNDACAIPKSVTSNTIVLNGTAKQDIDLEAAIPALIDGTFCFGKEVDLVAVAGSDLVKYQWLAADRSMLSSDASYSFSATESTTLVLKTTAPAGCYTNAGTSKERTINIEVEAPITITNLGYTDDSLDLQSICVGNKGIFTVMGTASQYKWFVNGTEDAALVDATVSIANLQNGDSVRVEAQSLAGCPVRAKASIAVVVDKMPRKGLVTGTEPVYHCAGKDTVARTTETQKYTYTWKSGNTVLSTDSILKTRSESKGTVTIQNGACVVNFPFEVRETAFGIKLNASPAENFEPGEALDLSTSVSGNKYDRNIVYQWSPTAILATPNAANTKANPTETVFVKVMATSPEGCMAKDSLELKKRNKLFIPNALTPESGDQNAAWNISGTENYPDLDIKVFNRWGVLVHSQTGYTAPWDGNLNGKPLPAGTYYFVIKHRTLDKPLVGDLTIVR